MFLNLMAKLNGKVKKDTSNAKTHIVLKTHIKSIIEKHIHELFATMMDTLELINEDGKSLGSGWTIKAIDKLCVDKFQTKDLRGSGYIETP